MQRSAPNAPRHTSTYGRQASASARDEGATSEQLADAWGGPIRWCIEQFGVDRCMFESNFPVDRASCDYVTLWNAFKRIASGASASDKDALFAGTARRAYDI